MTKIKVGGYPKPPFYSLLKVKKMNTFDTYRVNYDNVWYYCKTKKEAQKYAQKLVSKGIEPLRIRILRKLTIPKK